MQEPEDPKHEDGAETWGEDQKRRRYYYDDAHGYERYDPAKETEDDGDEVAD